MTPKWDFGVAMLPVGALCFYQAHFGRTVFPKWPFWAHLFYSVFYSVSELRRACFRQACVAQAVLPPGALFRAGAFALPPCAPKSHMSPLPHLGASECLENGQTITPQTVTWNSPNFCDVIFTSQGPKLIVEKKVPSCNNVGNGI